MNRPVHPIHDLTYPRIRRVIWFATVVGLVASLLAPSTLSAGPDYPKSMASTGDSATRAAGTGLLPWTDNPAASWSTGTDTRVNSHYLRLLALTPKISGKNYNDARSGAKMADLARQMGLAVSQRADYVTVLMGANDLCTPSVAAMTPVLEYETSFESAMDTLTTKLPRVRVFVASIPNVYRLWEILKDNVFARTAWDLLDVCQSMLANPLSTDQADLDRRQIVRQREMDYNAALGEVCAHYTTQCRYDGGAVFDADFTAADVVIWDYFHPSIAGQAKLAAGTWAYSYWGP
jgi:lysophospholipase L1-like esterase